MPIDILKLTEGWSETDRQRATTVANSLVAASIDEDTVMFAAMIAGDKLKFAEIRANTISGSKPKLEHAKQLVEALGFSKGHTLDAEIFAVGTWNRVWKFTAKDLDDIAANFNTLAENHKVPLKFGHNEKQPMTDGQPALGWVTKVWRNGNKLFARFENVPTVVFKAMEAKLYRHVSVELDVDVEHKGKKYKYVLSAVALLGADTPAVNSISDLTTYLDGSERLAASRREVFSTVNGTRYQSFSKEREMTPEEVQAAITKALDPIQSQLTSVTKENETLKAENAKFKADKEAAEKDTAANKIKMHRQSLSEKLETAVKNKQLLPAQREAAIKFMRIDKDESVLSVTADEVDEYIKVNGSKAVKFSKENDKQQGRGNGSNDAETYDDAGAEINRRAKKLQSEDPKLTFAAARDKVMEGDPELGKAWLLDDEAA